MARPKKTVHRLKRVTIHVNDEEKQAIESAFENVSQRGREILLGLAKKKHIPQPIPLLGYIAGGPAIDTSINSLPDHAFVTPPFELNKDCYSLIVLGDSMENSKGYGPSIPDGHYAFFCPDNSPFYGAIVHAEFPQEDGTHKCTLKRYYDKGNGTVELAPLNTKKYKPTIYKKGEFEVRGIFKTSWDGKAPEEVTDPVHEELGP